MGIRTAMMAGVLGAGLMGFAPGEIALSPVVLSDVALRQFGTWDENQDGVLSDNELDSAILNPDVRGANAAAAVALRKYLLQEAKAGNKVKLTKEIVGSEAVRNPQKSYKLALSDTDAASLDDDARNDAEGEEDKGEKKTKSVPTPQALFDRARRTMAKPLPPLFEDEDGKTSSVPVLSKTRQGGMGDCYLVAVLGAQVNANPKRIAEMLTRVPGDVTTFKVAWGDGTMTEVEALTHGERAMGGAGTAGGMWVRVFEKALLKRKLPEDKQDAVLTQEAIGKGGNQRQIMRLMTGHVVRFERMFGQKKTAPPPEDLEEKVKTLRPALVETLKGKRLVMLGTPGGSHLPPGIAGKHCYAVIGYDEATDVLKVWNPWGNKFIPKGEPGLEHGYKTRGGVFEVPFKDAARCFTGLSWETEKPLGEVPWKKSVTAANTEEEE